MIKVQTQTDRFEPGDTIRGPVEWDEMNLIKQYEARLIWYTAGKGDCDFEIIDRRAIETKPPSGNQEFVFNAPDYPPSFSGKLISLIWAIELVNVSNGDFSRCEIVIAPKATEVLIHEF